MFSLVELWLMAMTKWTMLQFPFLFSVFCFIEIHHTPNGILFMIFYILVLTNMTGIYNWAASWQNQQNGMCASRRLRSAWASAQSDQSLRCPHEEVWVLSYSLSAQRGLWSDWADAQADLSLRCAHMPFCCAHMPFCWFLSWGGSILCCFFSLLPSLQFSFVWWCKIVLKIQ